MARLLGMIHREMPLAVYDHKRLAIDVGETWPPMKACYRGLVVRHAWRGLECLSVVIGGPAKSTGIIGIEIS